MNLLELVGEMRQKANEVPFHPGVENILDFRRDVVIDDYPIKIQFTRTVVGRHQFYQLSMGNDAGDPSRIPRPIVEKLRYAFVPNGIRFPSALGNCIQFIEGIS